MNGGNLRGIREHNPQLLAMSYVQRIQELVKVAGDAGLLVLLDAHVVRAGVWPDGGKVDADGRALLTRAWQRLSGELCKGQFWNVIGADLKNEPCAASN
jgi:aryl-phospho-beta-D-glucosidase BglC (GH1 family)